jgi:hypothetical protein
MSEQITFIDRCLAGSARPEDIDEWVDAWHAGAGSESSLAQYLGMSQEDYAVWAEQPDSLPFILHARRFRVPLKDAVTERDTEFRLAARASPSARASLLAWLKRTGRL